MDQFKKIKILKIEKLVEQEKTNMADIDKNNVEKETKNPVVFSFIRGNPPTKAHRTLTDKLSSKAIELNAVAYLFLSQTKDSTKNPLDWNKKIYYFSKFVKPNIIISTNENVKTVIQAVQYLETLGYTDLYMLVGGDRKSEFEVLLNKYNGKDFTFNSIVVESIGERDPDSDTADLQAISATRLRKNAIEGNFEDFFKICAFYDNKELAVQLYNDVRNELVVLEKQSIKYIKNSIKVLPENYKILFKEFLELIPNIKYFYNESKNTFKVVYPLSKGLKEFKEYVSYFFNLKYNEREDTYKNNAFKVKYFLQQLKEENTKDVDNNQSIENKQEQEKLDIRSSIYDKFDDSTISSLKSFFSELEDKFDITYRKGANDKEKISIDTVINRIQKNSISKKVSYVYITAPSYEDRWEVAEKIAKYLETKVSISVHSGDRPAIYLFNGDVVLEFKDNPLYKNGKGENKTENQEKSLLIILYKEIERISDEDIDKILPEDSVYLTDYSWKRSIDLTVNKLKREIIKNKGYVYCRKDFVLPEGKESFFTFFNEIYKKIIDKAKKENNKEIFNAFGGNYNSFYPADIVIYKESEYNHFKSEVNSIVNNSTLSVIEVIDKLGELFINKIKNKSILGISVKKVSRDPTIEVVHKSMEINLPEKLFIYRIGRSKPYTEYSLNESIYDIICYITSENNIINNTVRPDRKNDLELAFRTKGSLTSFRLEYRAKSKKESRIGEAPINAFFTKISEYMNSLEKYESFRDLRQDIKSKILREFNSTKITNNTVDTSITSNILKSLPSYDDVVFTINRINNNKIIIPTHSSNKEYPIIIDNLIGGNTVLDNFSKMLKMLLLAYYKTPNSNNLISDISIKFNEYLEKFITFYIQLIYIAFLYKVIYLEYVNDFVVDIYKYAKKMMGIPYILVS